MIRRRLYTIFSYFHNFSVCEKLGLKNSKHHLDKFGHDVLDSYINDNELVNNVFG